MCVLEKKKIDSKKTCRQEWVQADDERVGGVGKCVVFYLKQVE